MLTACIFPHVFLTDLTMKLCFQKLSFQNTSQCHTLGFASCILFSPYRFFLHTCVCCWCTFMCDHVSSLNLELFWARMSCCIVMWVSSPGDCHQHSRLSWDIACSNIILKANRGILYYEMSLHVLSHMRVSCAQLLQSDFFSRSGVGIKLSKLCNTGLNRRFYSL